MQLSVQVPSMQGDLNSVGMQGSQGQAAASDAALPDLHKEKRAELPPSETGPMTSLLCIYTSASSRAPACALLLDGTCSPAICHLLLGGM